MVGNKNKLPEYPRDLVGYNGSYPNPKWPEKAKVAIQFVLNYEEGAENCILHGDKQSETFLSEIIGAAAFENARHMSMESIYEYGSRAGVWRILTLFRERQVPITIFGVAMAMQRHPRPIEQALKDGHEICSHGLRWINYHGVDINTEREHLQEAIEIHQQVCGNRPLGWYTGRTSENTRTLLSEEGGFIYDADDYSDDLPFWSQLSDKPHLIVPYTLDCNDMRFATAQGFHTSDQFYHYLKDAFDTLYIEGDTAPKMMSIGLHCRLVGRPGRFIGLQRFLDYVLSHEHVWLARRIDIANHWITTHPFQQRSKKDF